MARRLGEHHLQRRPHARLQQMAAARLAVGTADDDVRVDFRLATVQRDVPDQREDLDLLAQRDPLVVARLAIEIAEGHPAEGAAGGAVRAAEPPSSPDTRRSRPGLAPLTQYDPAA